MPSLCRGHPRTLLDWPPISRGQKIGISNNRAGQISHVVITIIIVGRPVQPNSHRSGGGAKGQPQSAHSPKLLVPSASDLQLHRTAALGAPASGPAWDQPRKDLNPAQKAALRRQKRALARRRLYKSRVPSSTLPIPAGRIHQPRGHHALLFP